MDLPLSTVARLMRQLSDAGLLYRSEPDSRYALGYRVFALAAAGVSRIDLAEVALPVMRQLRDASGETTSLHVVRGTQRVCIAEMQSHAQVRRVVPPGSTNQLAGTATGDVLLVGASPAEFRAAVTAVELRAKPPSDGCASASRRSKRSATRSLMTTARTCSGSRRRSARVPTWSRR